MYYTLGDTTLHFIAISANLRRPLGRGNVMSENLNRLSNRSLRRPGWMRNASRPPRDYFTNVD